MERDELIRRLMKTFVGELEEHARTLERELLALERGPEASARDESLRTLFRAAHSLKGAARAVNVGALEAVGHRLESIIADMRDGALPLERELFRLLFTTVDEIRRAGRRLEAGEDLADQRFAVLLAGADGAPAGPRVPPASPPGAQGDKDGPPAPTPPLSATAPQESLGAMPRDDMRVSVQKLDQLLALGGELLVARRRAAGRSADVDRLLEMVKGWEAEWRSARMSGRAVRRQVAGAGPPPSGTATAVRSQPQWFERTGENLGWLRRQLEELLTAMTADYKALEHAAAPLEAELLRARTVSFAWACAGFDRAVRDLAQDLGKEVDLVVRGGEIEFDRSIVERLKDPLLHLLRNAVSHGIEAPDQRRAAGKPARGLVTMTATLRNGRVEISAADDGRGLDVEAIRERAGRQGLIVPDSQEQIARLAFIPGLSTSRTLTEISGRGVGLDIVKTAAESLGGSVDIDFERGAGTRVTLIVPLSLTRVSALLVSSGGQTYAFDSAAVQGLVRVLPDRLRTMDGRYVLPLDDGPVPVFVLSDVLGQPAHEPPRADEKIPLVILGMGAERAGFVVSALLAEQEVVVKDLGPRLPRIRNVTGATILPTGRIALLLNSVDLIRTALGIPAGRVSPVALAARPEARAKRLLVVEDSVTTRALVKSILEAAGYEVMAAADGVEAWQILLEKEPDLVVSDVEMPRMDGFALTEAIRASKRFRNLPVILVTALKSEQDRMRGLEVGADAYLVKSAFDQSNLIQTIQQLL